MILNILKNIFLGLFGIAVVAMGITIIDHFIELVDSFIIKYMSLTWTLYIICKTIVEYDQFKKINKDDK